MTQFVVVDFDRTLFNNHEFFSDFSTVLASYYNIDGQELHQIAHKHDVVRTQATGIFSAFDEIREHNPDVEIEHLKQTARNELMGRSYLFVDSLPFINTLNTAGIEFLIMTVGTDEYQGFKTEFAPELNAYTVQITQGRKSDEIEQIAEQKGVEPKNITLIDDRGDTFDQKLRDMGVRGVRLRRVDSQYSDIQSPGWVKEISSLGEFEI
jgi:FMN phosphatase YigB (HAD superfamily)